MVFDYRLRTQIFIILFSAACCYWNSGWHWRKLGATLSSGPPLAQRDDEITRYIKRFDGIKNALPAHGVVGYFSDMDPGTDGMAGYYLAQHALAPVVVEKSTAHELIVGNIHVSSKGGKLISAEKLDIVKDYGTGVLLLRGGSK